MGAQRDITYINLVEFDQVKIKKSTPISAESGFDTSPSNVV